MTDAVSDPNVADRVAAPVGVTNDIGRRTFMWAFAAIVVGALVWRVAYVLVFKYSDLPVGDEIYYSAQGITIFHGGGYRYPFPPGGFGANHAPFTAAALAPVSTAYDGSSVGLQRLLMALYGTMVVAGIGLLAAQIFNRRIALFAAALAAGYGAFWLNDVVLMSETFATAGVVGLFITAYAYRSQPRLSMAVAIGAVIGLAGLARAELLVFGGVVGGLMIVTSARRNEQRPSIGTGLTHLVVAGLCAVVVIAPWVIRNQVRFDESAYISTQDGLTLIGANCPDAYNGPGKGFWMIDCIDIVTVPDGADQSVASGLYRDYAVDYIGEHLDEVPGVVAARLGRGLSVWRVEQMAFLNTGEGRGMWGSRIATLQYWLLVPAAVVGFRRWPSGLPKWPVLTVIGFTVMMLAVVYGIPRFRVPAEVGIVLGAAVALEHWSSSMFARLRPSHQGGH